MGVGRRSGTGYSNGARRAYYPSGPWIDGVRPPESEYPTSPGVTVPERVPAKLPNPDPSNYKVVKADQVGAFLIIMIHYPDCTNFEGNKILVFRGLTAIDLLNQRVIDPHFFQDAKVKSPVARFVPTEEGWKMAVAFARMMEKA